MKTSLLSLAAAALLLVSNVTFAASPPNDRRSDKEFNYGYPRNYKVSAKERARYEDEQRKFAEQQRKQAEQQRKLADRRDDRDSNFGYPKSHQVTPQERARWETAQRNGRDRR